MPTESFANNATSTLASALNNVATTVLVADGSKFPSSGQFRLKVDNELMLCTSRTGNSLTVSRGVESTTAASHLSGATATHIVTAGALEKLKDDVEEALIGSLSASEYVKTDGSGNLVSTATVPLADLANTGGSAGDVAYWNGTNWVRLAVGSGGRIFVVNSGGTAPSWSNALVVGASSLTIGLPETVNGARTTGDARSREDELTTSSAGAQALLTAAIPVDSVLVLDVEILGIEAGAVGARWYKKSRAFLNDGGTITAGTQRDVDDESLGTPTNAWTVTLDENSGNARAMVDGGGTEQVKWYLISQRVRVTAA